MPIVFDEVTGSVEPARDRGAREAPGAAGPAPSSEPRPHQLRAELRRLHLSSLRTRAT